MFAEQCKKYMSYSSANKDIYVSQLFLCKCVAWITVSRFWRFTQCYSAQSMKFEQAIFVNLCIGIVNVKPCSEKVNLTNYTDQQNQFPSIASFSGPQEFVVGLVLEKKKHAGGIKKMV